mmetsp:Transcript_11467/g.26680  ORF Transcript_11467/g.26680 Transcript_11467/m.26680 type:complete len:161 (+) Transcript_11467:854-1336(+)
MAATAVDSCRDTLIVEWIDVEAGVVLPQWKQANMRGPYTHVAFLEALLARFRHVQLVGFTMRNRRVYMASGLDADVSAVAHEAVPRLSRVQLPLLTIKASPYVAPCSTISTLHLTPHQWSSLSSSFDLFPTLHSRTLSLLRLCTPSRGSSSWILECRNVC